MKVSREEMKSFCSQINQLTNEYKTFSSTELGVMAHNHDLTKTQRRLAKVILKIRNRQPNSDGNYRFHYDGYTLVGLIWKQNKWETERALEYFMRHAFYRTPSLEKFFDNRCELLYRHDMMVNEFISFVRREFNAQTVCTNMDVKVFDSENLSRGPRPDAVARTANNHIYYVEYGHRICVGPRHILSYLTKYPIGKIVLGVLAISASALRIIKQNSDRISVFSPRFYEDNGVLVWDNVLKNQL